MENENLRERIGNLLACTNHSCVTELGLINGWIRLDLLSIIDQCAASNNILYDPSY